MNSRKILMLVVIMTGMIVSAKGQNKGYIVPANVFYIDAHSSPYNQVLPGDTLYFQAGNKDYLGIVNFTGSAAKPIIMVNLGGDVIIDTNHYYGIAIKNCRYIHLTGTGFPGSTYGFKVNRVAAGAGMEIGYLSSDYEIDHVSVQHTYVGGIYAKTDPDCTPSTQRSAFTQYNTVIHDNYVAYTVNEGMYIGSSKYLGETIQCNGKDTIVMPSLLDGVKVYNNIVTHTGYDGIQVGCAYKNCAIYNNTITFDSDAGVDTQMSGIMINYGTRTDCYNNYIVDGKGDGIDCLGLGGTRIFNNIIVNPGKTYYPGDFSYPKHGLYVSGQSVERDSSFYIFNNNIINPKSEGIRFSCAVNKGNLVSSNVIINPGAFDYYQNGNTSFKGINSYVMIQDPATDVTLKNNYFQRDGSAAGFTSATMHAAGDFALLAGSPLIDGADTNPKVSTAFDFGVKPRPYGPVADIGAYEFQGATITRTGGTIAQNQSICLASIPSALTSLAAASGLTGTPEYKWQSSTSGATGSFTDIPGTNALTYSPGTLTTTTWYVRLARTVGAPDWNGAVASNTVSITMNPLPAALAGTDRSIAPGTSTQLGALPVTGSSYNWTSNPSGCTSTVANPTVSPLLTTVYTLRETITATGCTNTHNVTVTPGTIPAAVAGADRSICLNTGTQIGATPVTGSIYNWTSNPAGFTSTLANPVVYPTVNTTYTLVETTTTTGSTNSNSVVVTVNPLPLATAGTDRSIISGTSTQIGAAAISGSAYNWTSSPAGFTSTLANPTVSPSAATIYTLIETITATGCTNSHSVTVTPGSLPAAAAGANRSICLNTGTQIGASPVTGSTYSWTSNPAGFTSTSANPVVYPAVTTTYTLVETTTATGSTNSNSVVVTVNPLPAAATGNDRAICLNSSTQIGAVPVTGNSYSWTSTPSGFTSILSSPVVSPLVTTTYNLVETVLATGCSWSHNVTVIVNPIPAAVAGANVSIGQNSSVQIGAAAVSGDSYNWTSNPVGFTSTLSNPIVSPLVTTTYTVVETNPVTGCSNSHSVVVSVNIAPMANAGTNRAICLNTGTQIGASPVTGNTYIWTSNPAGFTSTVANPVVYPKVTTTYTLVETTTATRSTNTHAVVVTVNPLPTAATGNDRAICASTSTQLGALPVSGSSYSWTSTPSGFTSTQANPTVSPLGTTSYNLVETVTATGCSWSHNVSVIVNPPASQPGNYTSGSSSVSYGQSNVIYTVPYVAGITYQWGYSGKGVTISGTSNSVKLSFSSYATSGTLSVTASNGCGTSIPRSMIITLMKGAIIPESAVVPDSTIKIVSNLTSTINIPEAFNLLNIYPNPSAGSTNFEFQIGEDAKVTLDIFNMTGQRMASVYNDMTDAGSMHKVLYNLALPSGVYPCILKWKGKMISTKLMIEK